MKLHEKVVLVTGGSRGIGKAISKLFVEEGAHVIITSKNISKLEETAKEINCSFFIDADIKNEKDVNDVINKIIKKFGRIDILVNNAGILPEQKQLEHIDENNWNEIIDVNLTGQFRFTKAVIPHMKKNGGSIINMSSDAGLKAFENFYADAYVASKAAIIMLTKSWALQFASDNIRVNCICASVVETDMTNSFWLDTEIKRKNTSKAHPLGRIGTGQDIAYASLYFASDDSSWTTGAILTVDGGVSIK